MSIISYFHTMSIFDLIGSGHGGGARHTIASLSSKLGRASFTAAQC